MPIFDIEIVARQGEAFAPTLANDLADALVRDSISDALPTIVSPPTPTDA